MRKIMCLLMIILLVMVILGGSACETSDIKSNEEASKAVSDLGEDIGSAGTTLDEIDEGLGTEEI